MSSSLVSGNHERFAEIDHEDCAELSENEGGGISMKKCIVNKEVCLYALID